jgi:NADPH:quinone reductase-like Zn-dependent oxidoreductase
MKAAVLHQVGQLPKYDEMQDPTPKSDEQVVLHVKAAGVKQLDRSKASGKHYTSYPSLPTAVGTDGAGLLDDGTKAYAVGITGTIAEKALIGTHSWVPLPDNIDFAVAAALPNALLGSDAALLYRAKMKKGDVVLVNGATGVTGKVAVQIAKYRGASRVIATGRNEAVLEDLKKHGADEIIPLKQDDATIIETIKNIHQATPIDIVLDYLWGHPVELILAAVSKCKPRLMKMVTIGEMAGSHVSLPSGILRSSQIELLGSGIGSIPHEDIIAYMKGQLPEIFKLAADDKLVTDIVTYPLAEVETVWATANDAGKRVVIMI